MKPKAILPIVLIVFAAVCFYMIYETGLFAGEKNCNVCIPLQNTVTERTADKNEPADQQQQQPESITTAPRITFTADNAPSETIMLGSDPNKEDHDQGFKYQLELTNTGASIKTATFTAGKETGFTDRDPDNPQPLKILSPMRTSGRVFYSLANRSLMLNNYDQRFPLDKLNWQVADIQKTPEYQKAAFHATILTSEGQEVIKAYKTFTIEKSSYLMKADLRFENLSPDDESISFTISGPGGLSREGFRDDMRKVMTLFEQSQGEFKAVEHKSKDFDEDDNYDELPLLTEQGNLLWGATANKYFSTILVPSPGQSFPGTDWIAGGTAQYFNPDGTKDTGDETLGFIFRSQNFQLSPGSSEEFNFEIYLGPKDRTLFSNNEHYNELGFYTTVDLRSCCCPKSIMNPMSFLILKVLNLLYAVIGNYGVALIILVFFIRLLIHPLTKKSQVTMHRFSKLGPKMQELKEKYKDNQKELNKRMMELYKEQGASPFMGMLPMFVQMPIWIALYSAIYSSVELRGAEFLPFWITDLSVPDALFRFNPINLPIFGAIDSFNLLPILMGVAFYLQQKMMPSTAATASPQAEQQQKMMKIMMPILFPLMFYKMPAGLNLYIMASTFAGVIEQKVIRKHIEEREADEKKGKIPVTSKTGGKKKKKKPKPFYKNK